MILVQISTDESTSWGCGSQPKDLPPSRTIYKDQTETRNSKEPVRDQELMVVEANSRVEVMEGNQQRVEANILLLGAHDVGKSGRIKIL